ncbi:hypothetical protein LPJ73_008656, partial [Coemansia sp. RSA 2703]
MDETNITLVKYKSGLGVPGIMGPKPESAVEITTAPDGKTAKVVKTKFEENGREESKKESQMTSEGVVSVLAQVENLQKIPMQSAPGIPDVFGKNTVVIVRKGKEVLWAYTPGSGGCCSGCGAHEEEEQQ